MRSSILFVGSFLASYVGSRSVGEELANQLEKKGWNIILTSRKINRGCRLLDMLLTVIFRRKEFRIACVEVYSGPAFIWAEVVCTLLKFLKKPIILTLHGGNLPFFSSRHTNRMLKLFTLSQIITAPSKYLIETMKNYCNDIYLIPNPININLYKFKLRTSPSPRLVWLRAFHSIYNPKLAVDVIALLTNEFPTIRLVMIGPDKGDGSLQETEQMISQCGLREHFSIINGIPKTDVPLTIGNENIFINTSNIDNTPVSVIEAMACGQLVVSTNVGGISYLLEDENDALLVPPNDANAMAMAVKRILSEPGLAEKLSANARKKAERYDWSIVLPKWEKLFDSIS